MGKIGYSLAQIEAFVCVGETGSLTHAATRLGKDRTTVRELVDYLELYLGYAVFEHGARPLVLTQKGRQFHHQASLFLQQAQAFDGTMQRAGQHSGGHLRLGYDGFVAHAILLQLATRLAQDNCPVDFLFQSRTQAEVALEDGRIDLALCLARRWCMDARKTGFPLTHKYYVATFIFRTPAARPE